MTNKIRTIHYGLGSIGSDMARLVAQRTNLEIVGGIDVDKQKVGRDIRSERWLSALERSERVYRSQSERHTLQRLVSIRLSVEFILSLSKGFELTRPANCVTPADVCHTARD